MRGRRDSVFYEYSYCHWNGGDKGFPHNMEYLHDYLRPTHFCTFCETIFLIQLIKCLVVVKLDFIIIIIITTGSELVVCISQEG